MQVALSVANLAALMQAQGKTSTAEELVRRALSIREDALGPDHPLVMILYIAESVNLTNQSPIYLPMATL